MSEAIAIKAMGIQNMNFNVKYIEKTEWNDDYLRKSLEYLETSDGDNNGQRSEPTNIKLHGTNEYNLYTYSYIIDRNNIDYNEIDNFTLHIHIDDFNRSIVNDIMNWHIQLIIGGTYQLYLNMALNLFLCKILHKKIVETSDELIIPIILFEITEYGKLPLYLLKWYDAKIRVYMGTSITQYKIALYADTYKLHENELKPMRYIIFQINELSCDTLHVCLIFSHIVQFIYFVFDIDDIPIQTEVNKIELSLNKQSPIVWETNKNEIINLKFYNKQMYIISLIPDIKKLADIRNMFKNVHKNAPTGINFSRIDNADISIDMNTDNNHIPYYLGCLNTNEQVFKNGMSGIIYIT